jgi:hypothetical protein
VTDRLARAIVSDMERSGNLPSPQIPGQSGLEVLLQRRGLTGWMSMTA